ncbi:MAG TPA: helix-turn-helix domain-containing protein [Polyangiaceae bacterium]|nr:helix-turn-helix domain-containing protein [Polyangiaceae bacterium]
MSAPLAAAAKRAQASAYRALAAAHDLEADALESHATPEADPFLNLRAGAALTGKSPRAIRDAIGRDELAGYGRPVVVRRSDLLAWLEGRKVRTRATSSDADAAYLALVGGAS